MVQSLLSIVAQAEVCDPGSSVSSDEDVEATEIVVDSVRVEAPEPHSVGYIHFESKAPTIPSLILPNKSAEEEAILLEK